MLPFVGKVVGVDEPIVDAQFNLDANVLQRGINYCRQALQNGTADIWLMQSDEARQEHLGSCARTELASFLAIIPTRYRFTTNGVTERVRALPPTCPRR